MIKKFQESYIKIGDIKIHYLTSGKGESLIIIPSLWLTSKSYIPLGQELSLYYKVIIPDLNKGLSKFLTTISSVKEYADLLYRFIKALRIKKCYLIGISFSGVIAAKYASKYPNIIKRLFLVSSTTVSLPLNIRLPRLLYGYCRLLIHNQSSIKGKDVKLNLFWIRETIFCFFKHPRQSLYEGLTAAYFNDNITDLKIPTKLIFSLKDEFIPLGVLKTMKKISNLTIQTVDDYHAWFFSKEKKLAREIISFFEDKYFEKMP